MSRVLVLATMVLGLVLNVWAAERTHEYGWSKPVTQTDATRHPVRNLDEIIYFEGFESGDLSGWTPIDLTAAGATWHTDAYQAFGGAGMSWWVGDPEVGNNGGYLDDWYMVLDSPPIQLAASNPMVSFQHRWSCEDTAGVAGQAPGYTGWDGMNLRISTNGGQTWTVVPNNAMTPGYSCTSSYAFGFQHGEGVNVPAWCGTANGNTWHGQTANLATWAGQSVKLRWAFASDPSYSTPNNQAMFGWMVDNIRVYSGTDTVYAHDGNDNTGWNVGTNVPVGGNLWRIANDPSAPTDPNVVVCNNIGSGLYNANMNTVLESPLIDISGLSLGILTADFIVTGAVACTQEEFPDCDYWGAEISFDEGFSWCAVSDPGCTDLPDYVYIDAPQPWGSFNESYATPIDLSAYMGEADNIKFRFTFESNGDTDYEIGPSFDDFFVEHQAGFPNDISCYTLQIKYPTTANRPISVKAYFENTGQVAQAQVAAWYRVTGSTQLRFLPNLQLEPGATDTRTGTVTIASAGTREVKAWSALEGDMNLENDTSTTAGIDVRASNLPLELGYDNREVALRYNYQTGQGALVHFTPEADGIQMYSLVGVRARFDAGQVGDLPINLHVYEGGETVPNTANEIYDEQIIVAQGETGPTVWKDIDLTSLELTSNQDLWVWLEVVATGGGDRYPQVLGANGYAWTDQHHFTWGGTGAPTPSTEFYQIHALVNEATDADDAGIEIPNQFSLSQNYPNPFNPSTEIQFSVPRSDFVKLTVYNLLGQEVATLVNGTRDAGVHTVTFDASTMSSGVYVYRLQSTGFEQTRKMLLMK